MKKHGYDENANQIGGSNETVASTTGILTLLGYKGKKKNARKKNKELRPLVAAHTDMGVITILLYEPTGGCAKLQRKDEEGQWNDVLLPPLSEDPVFVVHTGDCLSDMTGGTLRSTLHRVVLTGGIQESQCLAMCIGLNPDVVLLQVSGGTTVTYEEWRRRRLIRAQAILKG
jgi:isopenicillin N synthase-like dioxygenase